MFNLNHYKFDIIIFLILILVFYLLFAVFNGFFWTYTINEWNVFLGRQQNITIWDGILVGCVPFFGQLGTIAAGATFIAALLLL